MCKRRVYLVQFKCRTFHVPNLIPSIKYMKRSTFESILSPSCLIWVDPRIKIEWPAPQGISTVERQTSNFSCAEPNA